MCHLLDCLPDVLQCPDTLTDVRQTVLMLRIVQSNNNERSGDDNTAPGYGLW